MTLVDRLCEVARSQVGIKEGADNDTKYGRWFGTNHLPWCGAFVSWCFAQVAGVNTPLRGIQTPKGFAGTQLAARWAKKSGRLFSTPMKGDVVVWRHTATTGHTGIVVGVHGDQYDVIEGNTNRQNSRTGGEVELHTHRIGDGQHGTLVGFIRPKWGA
jgi:CHAP domain